VQTVELVPGGSEKPVTRHNRQDFVDLVVDWHLNKSVEKAFAVRVAAGSCSSLSLPVRALQGC
jgi:HECT-domain (ubiquitin-transferase)